MAKIKSRKKKLREYNERYPVRDGNIEKVLRSYIQSQKDPDKVIELARQKAELILESRSYESIRITFYEDPFQTERPRTFAGHIYSPNAAENHSYFEKAIRSIRKTVQLINTPAEIEVFAYLEMPKAVPPDEVILFECKILNPVDKPDYDNVGKCYTDMLTEVLTLDDDIFWRGEIRKYYSLLPRVEILIRYITQHESKYIYKKLKNRKTIKAGLEAGYLTLRYLGEDRDI